MKSKKFFILALAAAVLFAFAACQPSMPVYRNVDYITINQTEDILVGESATSDMFEIIAHYTDGTAEPVNGVIEVASSSVTASINSAGIFFNPARNRTIEEPNCQTTRSPIVANARCWLPSQSIAGI